MGGNQKKHSTRVKLLYSLKSLIKVSRNLESPFSSGIDRKTHSQMMKHPIKAKG